MGLIRSGLDKDMGRVCSMNAKFFDGVHQCRIN